MKQKQGRGVFRPGLPVENGQVVDLHGAIRHRGVHRFLLLLVLSQNPAWSQQYQEKHCDDEKDRCFLVAMRVNTPSHLRSDFKNHFQLDRHPEWQTCHAEHDPSR